VRSDFDAGTVLCYRIKPVYRQDGTRLAGVLLKSAGTALSSGIITPASPIRLCEKTKQQRRCGLSPSAPLLFGYNIAITGLFVNKKFRCSKQKSFLGSGYDRPI
jgi:hypothetical protein